MHGVTNGRLNGSSIPLLRFYYCVLPATLSVFTQPGPAPYRTPIQLGRRSAKVWKADFATARSDSRTSQKRWLGREDQGLDIDLIHSATRSTVYCSIPK